VVRQLASSDICRLTPDATVSFPAPSLDGNRHPTSDVRHILLAVDRGDFAELVLLDLSAVFDTVDHDILLRRLQTSFGIDGVALDWFRSYLVGRTPYVRRGPALSSIAYLTSC